MIEYTEIKIKLVNVTVKPSTRYGAFTLGCRLRRAVVPVEFRRTSFRPSLFLLPLLSMRPIAGAGCTAAALVCRKRGVSAFLSQPPALGAEKREAVVVAVTV